MKRMRFVVVLAMVGGAAALPGQVRAETHAEIQAVDANGNPTHSKVLGFGIPWDPSKEIVLEGIALNAPDEIVPTDTELLIAFQGEGDDHAGTQIWSGGFFQDWPGPYEPYFAIQPGDRIRVTGFCAQFVGKTNVNEQHNSDPSRDFTIEVLGHPGMPVPELVPSCAVANTFDATRTTGGEYYQSRWVRLNNLTITLDTIGDWAAGEEVTVTDGTDTFQMMLAAMGDFDEVAAPTGTFDAVAIFDQEPRPLDFGASRTEHYRLWLKRTEHLLPAGAPFLVTAWSYHDHGALGSVGFDVSVPGAVETRSGGPTDILVTFDMPIAGLGGLDLSDVAVSSGTVTGVSLDSATELRVALTGVDDDNVFTMTFPGIIPSAGGAAVSQALAFDVRVGDVDLDGDVNIFDLLAVRNSLTLPVTDANVRLDVDPSGSINIFDLLAVRNNL